MGDRDALVAARDASRAELAAWMPGVVTDLADLDAFLASVGPAWSSGDALLHAVVADGEVVGHVSLHRRTGRRGEVGYWVRTDRTGRGIATAAVLALVTSAPPDVEVLEIHCDEWNERSAAVASRAGFAHDRTVDVPVRTPAQSGREMAWVLRSPSGSGA